MKRDFQEIDRIVGMSTTRDDVVLEMERRHGPVTDEERSRIGEAYEELERSFLRFRNKSACFLIEWIPGTTGTFFEEPSHDRNGFGSERFALTGCGTALIRTFPDHSIRDCLFLLRMSEDPFSSEPRQFVHDHADAIRRTSIMEPPFTDYLYRYLLKTARGTDCDFRFTWIFGVSDVLNETGGIPAETRKIIGDTIMKSMLF